MCHPKVYMRIADQKCFEKGTWDGSVPSSHLHKNVYKDKTCLISFCQWGRRLVASTLFLHDVTPIFPSYPRYHVHWSLKPSLLKRLNPQVSSPSMCTRNTLLFTYPLLILPVLRVNFKWEFIKTERRNICLWNSNTQMRKKRKHRWPLAHPQHIEAGKGGTDLPSC